MTQAMSKQFFLRIALLVSVVALIALFYTREPPRRSFNWEPHYRYTSKDPYGSHYLYELLRARVADDDFVKINAPLQSVLDDSLITGANYVFLGEYWYYSTTEILALLSFVEKGNTAYILSYRDPYDIFYEADLFTSMYVDSFVDSIATMNALSLNGDTISSDFDYVYDWEREPYTWTYADSTDDERLQVMGLIGEAGLNYFRLSHGEGTIYFHLAPLVFTNYHLANEDKQAYAESVFSHLDDGPIYWDDYSYAAREDTSGPGPMSFILSQPSLRWAWYVILAGALIYIVLYTRRRQRVVPVVSHVRNTSVEFVETIGGMYYQQGAHLNIIRHQRNLLLTFIRSHYNIPTNKLDDDFLKKASLKSGVDANEIDRIIREARRLELKVEVKAEDLVEYDKLTRDFYKKCK